jgi:NhaP-type Na+/H+ or K+/H+ antiporter
MTRLERTSDDEAVEPLELAELAGQLLSGVVWFLFGAAIVARSFDDADWRIVVYAVLSLTVIRMVPVAVALVGMRLELPTIGFVGWFGPRGMASVVFALLAVDDLGGASEPLLTAVGVTVLLSVVAHGVTARPLAETYGRWAVARGHEHAANASVPPFRGRRWAAVPPTRP